MSHQQYNAMHPLSMSFDVVHDLVSYRREADVEFVRNADD
eukprot:CAMPEP_0116048938 /NCGR_PEP_ID=MMETSP0321-20121206/29875_1 /TAXON_ID=163516 /ORGANISM="Leptocylindrus danicus var. danicus, Strain B650" /LENGTH=39 /DNA_ID= /DNA_START= /DNA_END= /DNA_ORIENTATION=